jgi:hypothetical protein
MVARARPKPSPRKLEDLRRPSASSWCFSFVSAALWWMDGWIPLLGCLWGCIYTLGKTWGMLHLSLHEIFLVRQGNLVSINSASSRFFWFAAHPWRHHISHVRTPNNANSVSRLCATKLSRTLIPLLSLETKIRSPKLPRKIICLISDLSAQHVFREPYLLAPWPELGLPHVQIEAIVEAHNFCIQTFAIRGYLGLRIYTERSCCLGCENISRAELISLVNLQVPRVF